MTWSIAEDPVAGLQGFRSDPRGAEVAGIFAATLAIGNTTAIRGSFAELLRRADGDLVTHLVDAPSRERARRLGGFRHRWIRGDQMAFLAGRLHALHASGSSLEQVFADGLASGGFAGGLDRLSHSLRGPKVTSTPPRLPDPVPEPPRRRRERLQAPHALRPLDGEDGPSGPGRLDHRAHVGAPDPLDQHTYWIAYHLGLTGRRTRNWRTVEEVTEALRAVDADDPVKYDFVLCHTGISGDCPKHRDLTVCGPCVVRPDCRLWRGRRVAA